MQYLKAVKEPEPNREHIIEGIWATRALHIDDQPITLEMAMERMSDFYDERYFTDVQAFTWGSDAPSKARRVLAYACCQWTVPETSIRHFFSHMALEEFFIDQLKQLPSSDFTLRYTDRELCNAMRRIKCRWRTAYDERLLAAAQSIDSSPEWREIAVLLVQHIEDVGESWDEIGARSTTSAPNDHSGTMRLL